MSGALTLKLTSLIIRTVSKPVANAIKAQTRQSEFFKTHFVKFGQFINRVDLRLKNNSNVKVRPLNDNRAIETGSNFLSELFTLSIAGSLIIYESTRPKKDKVGDELKALRQELEGLRGEVESIKNGLPPPIPPATATTKDSTATKDSATTTATKDTTTASTATTASAATAPTS